jgi:hypothetical protein
MHVVANPPVAASRVTDRMHFMHGVTRLPEIAEFVALCRVIARASGTLPRGFRFPTRR